MEPANTEFQPMSERQFKFAPSHDDMAKAQARAVANMPKTDTAIAVTPTKRINGPSDPKPTRINGKFAPGVSGNPHGSPGRARQALNQDTIREMHLAFQRGGRAAIDKVMKNRPETFLKLLVLLVPRELQVEHKGGVKGMTDEQLEQGIEAIKAMLAARAGDSATVIEGVVEPAPAPSPKAKAVRRKTRKTHGDMVQSMGNTDDVADS